MNNKQVFTFIRLPFHLISNVKPHHHFHQSFEKFQGKYTE